MAKFRKKPIVIEAMRVPIEISLAWGHLVIWLGKDKDNWKLSEDRLGIDISTLEGMMRANPGDWIIRGVKDELYPIKDDIFKMTYESVEEW